MKCTQCGCERFIRTSLSALLHIGGEITCFEDDQRTEVYACLECGHLEFYNKSLPDKLVDTERTIKQLEEELASLLEEKESKNVTLKELTDKSVCIEKQLKSIDITIRQQSELKEELKRIVAEIQTIQDRIKAIELRIKAIPTQKATAESELHRLRVKCVAKFGHLF